MSNKSSVGGGGTRVTGSGSHKGGSEDRTYDSHGKLVDITDHTSNGGFHRSKCGRLYPPVFRDCRTSYPHSLLCENHFLLLLFLRRQRLICLTFFISFWHKSCPSCSKVFLPRDGC